MYNRYLPYQYCRSGKPLHPAPPPPKPPKKKLDFKTIKKDTCTSLNDVECFLNNFSNTWKYIRLINLLK